MEKSRRQTSHHYCPRNPGYGGVSNRIQSRSVDHRSSHTTCDRARSISWPADEWKP